MGPKASDTRWGLHLFRCGPGQRRQVAPDTVWAASPRDAERMSERTSESVGGGK